jgi:hypothetical protein
MDQLLVAYMSLLAMRRPGTEQETPPRPALSRLISRLVAPELGVVSHTDKLRQYLDLAVSSREMVVVRPPHRHHFRRRLIPE